MTLQNPEVKTEITFRYPAELKPLVLEALSVRFGRPEEITDPETGEVTENPETKEDFAHRQIVEFIFKHVKAYQLEVGIQQAHTQVTQAVDALIEETVPYIEAVSQEV